MGKKSQRTNKPKTVASTGGKDVQPPNADASKKGKNVRPPDIGTFEKGQTSEETPLLREQSTVSMEDVETTEVAMPSAEEIKKWSPQQVLEFLEKKKDELFLNDKHIKIIEDQEVAGQDFLLLTEEKLMQDGLKRGPATRISQFVKEIKGEEQGTKRKYDESEDLSKIVKTAVREEFARRMPDVLSVSNLSEQKINKIMDDMELKIIGLSEEDFPSLNPVQYPGFQWDSEKDEDQQMQNVVKYFEKALKLPRNVHVRDVHAQVKGQRYLRRANVTLTGGTDIALGPSMTPCASIETKKSQADFKEGQAIGELFIADKRHVLNTISVLTDCNDHWIIFFFAKPEFLKGEQCLVKCVTGRGIALAVIRRFVLEEAKKILSWKGDIDTTANLPALPVCLENITKFLEHTYEAHEDRMTDMIGDMSENELFNMRVRKRLTLLRDWCDLDQQPDVDQLIRQFSDDYENPPPLMFA
ncbi:8134_t:CDS:2 [Ambispora leptoticha]|uniref:8134_t:CDS:1 n=1 Tax=Ambispora leptoticha TaxID=144679 RepID=A0A9N9CF55_9GLOM|nr:8134_t:CDS:2 [Ambispora leptoticha]